MPNDFQPGATAGFVGNVTRAQLNRQKQDMLTKVEERSKALVLEAFDTQFNERDYEAATRLWSSNYIQHGAHIEPGREGLFNLVRSLPKSPAIPARRHRCGRRLCDRLRSLLGQRPATCLDRGGRVPHRQWRSRRTLGCTSGRSDEGRIE